MVPSTMQEAPHLMQFGILVLEAQLDKLALEDSPASSTPDVRKVLEIEDSDSEGEEEEMKQSGIRACWWDSMLVAVAPLMSVWATGKRRGETL